VEESQSLWTLSRRFVWRLSTAIVRHDIASLAAMIAFYALFSLFPLILLIVYAVSVFLPHYVHIEQLLGLLRPYFPATNESKELIDSNILQLAQGGARVGLLSAVTLIWSATSGFIAVQQAMDVIWESQQRSFLTRRLISFLMLVVLLILMMGSSVIMALYPLIQKAATIHPGTFFWIQWLHGLSRIVFPFSLFLGCLVFYRFLPSRKAPWSVLIPGAFVATLALDKGRQMFGWYVGHLGRYHMIYGGLTVVILLVLWMYVGSIVVLFGAEVSAAMEDAIRASSD
jgi:membrane protein